MFLIKDFISNVLKSPLFTKDGENLKLFYGKGKDILFISSSGKVVGYLADTDAVQVIIYSNSHFGLASTSTKKNTEFRQPTVDAPLLLWVEKNKGTNTQGQTPEKPGKTQDSAKQHQGNVKPAREEPVIAEKAEDVSMADLIEPVREITKSNAENAHSVPSTEGKEKNVGSEKDIVKEKENVAMEVEMGEMTSEMSSPSDPVIMPPPNPATNPILTKENIPVSETSIQEETSAMNAPQKSQLETQFGSDYVYIKRCLDCETRKCSTFDQVQGWDNFVDRIQNVSATNTSQLDFVELASYCKGKIEKYSCGVRV